MSAKTRNAVEEIHAKLATLGAGVVVTVKVEDMRAYGDDGVSRCAPVYTVTLCQFIGTALVLETVSGTAPAGVATEVRERFNTARLARSQAVAIADAAGATLPVGRPARARTPR